MNRVLPVTALLTMTAACASNPREGMSSAESADTEARPLSVGICASN